MQPEQPEERRPGWTSDEERAEIEAEIARIASGQVKMYSGDEILRVLEEMERKFNEGDGSRKP